MARPAFHRPGRLRLAHQSSTIWGLLLPPQPREQEPPFRAGAGRGARHRPYPEARKKSGKSSAASSTRQRWWVPGGGSPDRLCPALAESAGQLPGHRHCRGRGGHSIPATTSAHPSVHQLPDQKQPARPPASRGCLAVEGGHRAGHQCDIPRVLQPVVPGPKKTGDLRPVIDLEVWNYHVTVESRDSQPSHGNSTLQDGDARVRPFSHQKSGVDSFDRHLRCLPSCSDAPGRPQVSALRGQQASLPVHLPSFRSCDIAQRVHQAAATSRSAVKAARCEATRLLRWLADQSRYSRTGQTACPDDHQCAPVSRLDHQLRRVRPYSKSRLPVHRDAVQHSTIHSGAPTEDASQSPDRSSTLDDQSEHQGQRSAQASRHSGVHGFAGTTGKTSASSSPMVGRHSMMPEDQELVRPDHSSSVGTVRGGLVGIPSSPARSTPRHQGDGSDSLHGCIQFGLGSPVRLTLDTRTVVSISKIVAHQCFGDAGRHQRCERFPASSEVPSDSLDVRQRKWLWLTSRTRGAQDRTLWCRWPYDCSSGATARRLCWFPSICQECTTSRRIPCPESARHWIRSGRWPWSVYDPCLPSGPSRRSTCLRHSPTGDSSNLYHHIRTPGQSGQTPCQCPGTTGGASCTRSRHSRWSLKFCRRSLSHQESGWFWLLHCNRQRHGFRSWWICTKKIRSRCSSRVKSFWLKMFWWAKEWWTLVTSGRQIYMRGNSTGHPEG